MGLKVLIVEDEEPARKRLVAMLQKYSGTTQIVGEVDSIEAGVNWFAANAQPDVVLLDIQLKDGLSHLIFDTVQVSCPVIFVTAYDHHMHKAFQYHCIDYLLKPIKESQLFAAMDKLQRNRSHFLQNFTDFIESLKKPPRFPKRLMLTKGLESLPVKTEEIAYFYTEHKVVFAVTQEGIKFTVQQNLTQLEATLNPQQFFRVNRKYLIEKEAIKSVQALPKGRVQVHTEPTIQEEVVVNQPKAASFNKWLLT